METSETLAKAIGLYKDPCPLVQDLTSDDIVTYGKELFVLNVAVVPMFKKEAMEGIFNMLQQMIREFPEFVPLDESVDTFSVRWVRGGFGAFANPSSFHHPIIRRLRELLKGRIAHILSIYKQLVPHGTALSNIEMLYDRLCYRGPGTGATSEETWHTDTFSARIVKLETSKRENAIPDEFSKNSGTTTFDTDKDVMFGGWVNLSKETVVIKKKIPTTYGTQRLVAILASINPATKGNNTGKGFDGKKNTDSEYYKAKETQMAGAAGKNVEPDPHVQIPIGSLVLMEQGTVHAVLPGETEFKSLRLFVGVRLSQNSNPLMPDVQQWWENGSVPLIPSGQSPPMYPNNNINTNIPAEINKGRFNTDLQTWAEKRLHKEYIEEIAPAKDHRDVFIWLPKRPLPGVSGGIFIYEEKDKQVLMPEKVLVSIKLDRDDIEKTRQKQQKLHSLYLEDQPAQTSAPSSSGTQDNKKKSATKQDATEETLTQPEPLLKRTKDNDTDIIEIDSSDDDESVVFIKSAACLRCGILLNRKPPNI